MISLLYSGLAIDRAAELRRDPGLIAALQASGEARILPYWRGRSLFSEAPAPVWAAGDTARMLAAQATATVFLGRSAGAAWFTADISALDGGDDGPRLGLPGRFAPLRSVGAALAADQAALLAFARGVLHWHNRHRYCSICGAATVIEMAGHVRRCPSCNAEHFPRTDPAVIVLVTDGDRCLLGRQANWPDGMYSCLAGFVEPGESLEEAAAREVHEETGIVIADTLYMASQPWPFPASLMIGFHARAIGGTLRVDTHELQDARWFSRSEVRRFATSDGALPRRDSIARWLIECWLR